MLMKKMFMVLGLIVLAMFVVSCAPGNFAGQAVKTTCNSNWEKYCSTLLEGEIRSYTIGDSVIKVTLKNIVYQDYVGGVHSATFELRSKNMKKEVTLLEGEVKTLDTAQEMILNELVYQNYAGGVHSALFCLSG